MKMRVLVPIVILISVTLGFLSGLIGGALIYEIKEPDGINDVINREVEVLHEESAIIEVSEAASPAVVSIRISQEVDQNNLSNPFLDDFDLDQPLDPELQQIGSGSGFIISADGMIITNRHVAEDENATYTVVLNNGDEFEAEVVAKDTLLDIAFLDVEAEDLPFLELGTSSELKIGQSVIAIGNALGEFSNSVSSGIVSGLGRNILASGGFGTAVERISDVIQTDASINPGNSGGPLLDLQGNVIGVNVAVAQDAENIGFAIPIDNVKDLLKRLDEKGEIDRPQLGVRYVLVNKQVAEEENLDVQEGALIPKQTDSGEDSIVKNSAAEKAGLKPGDVILEIDGEKINEENPLFEVIQKKFKGDKIELLILRGKERLELEATL
jgi:serine protease Do